VAQLGLPVVIIGGKEESDNGRIFNNLGSRIHNLTAKTDLLQLAAILKNARLVISGDSGPMHLACCLDTPVVAIFRNDLIEKGPKRWGPWGNYHRVIQHPSLSEITVEEVFGEVKELNAKVSFS
jgi:ADP-heptose:LPS heptosyltransferase